MMVAGGMHVVVEMSGVVELNLILCRHLSLISTTTNTL